MRAARLGGLIEQGDLLVIEMSQLDRVNEGERPARRFGVRKQAVLDSGAGFETQIVVGKGRGTTLDDAAYRPVRAQAASDKRARVILASHAGQLRAVGQLEPILAVPAKQRHADLPIFGRAVGRQRGAAPEIALPLLTSQVAAHPDPEDPEIPGVLGYLWRGGLGGRLVDDVEPLGRGQSRRVADEPQLQHAGQAGPHLIEGVGLTRNVLERVVHSLELLLTDQRQGKLRAPGPGPPCRHQQVHLGVPAVAHVVDEGDLAAEVIEVAEATAAVHEHAQRPRLRLLRDGRLLRRGGGRGDGSRRR